MKLTKGRTKLKIISKVGPNLTKLGPNNYLNLDLIMKLKLA